MSKKKRAADDSLAWLEDLADDTELAEAMLEEFTHDLIDRYRAEGGTPLKDLEILAGSAYLHQLQQCLEAAERKMWIMTPERSHWLSIARQSVKQLQEAFERLDAELERPLPKCLIPFGTKVRVVKEFTKGMMGAPVLGSEGITYKPDPGGDPSLVWVAFKIPPEGLRGQDGNTWLYDEEKDTIRYALPPDVVEVLR